jgi:hypothetical protein
LLLMFFCSRALLQSIPSLFQKTPSSTTCMENRISGTAKNECLSFSNCSWSWWCSFFSLQSGLFSCTKNFPFAWGHRTLVKDKDLKVCKKWTLLPRNCWWKTTHFWKRWKKE